MTPKDWDKIEKLLGPMADQETVEAVKSLVEGIETNLKGSLTANVVKSVQRGVITIASGAKSGTATITAVNTGKAVVLYTGSADHSANTSGYVGRKVQLVLTNSTTVTASLYDERGWTHTVPYQVIEYY